MVEKLREKLFSDWKGREKWLQEQRLDVPLLRDLDRLRRFERRVNVELARRSITVAAAKRDMYAVQAVRAIDDLDKTLNLFAGRIREWYGLHFPELDRLVEKHETYVRLIAELGQRRNFSPESFEKLGIPHDKGAEIAARASKSMGAAIEDEDLEWLKSFCRDVLELYHYRTKAEAYVEKVMKEAAPNMTTILGPVLSARILSMAGGLENLSKKPASTLQVLGAEKALFRSLKTGARPPKHGVIFQFAAIHQAPRWQRGKIARALAGKLAIAARLDAFQGENMGTKLLGDLEKKIAEIREKYKEPPARRGSEKRKS